MMDLTARQAWLRGVEATLLFTGVALGLWSVLTVSESRFFAQLPVPTSPPMVAQLPGEDPGAAPAAVRPTANLRTGDWVAKLEAPSVDLTATVLEGSDDATLSRAAGHIEGTALPGEAGNAGIAAHRDTIFRPVRNLKLGDVLRVTTATGTYEYRIDHTLIVNPEDVYVLDPTDQPTLTLVTCYPFSFIGHAPQRFIVKATRVATPPR